MPLGPAALGRHQAGRLRAGRRRRRAIGARVNLDELLDHKIGNRRVALTVARRDGGDSATSPSGRSTRHREGLRYRAVGRAAARRTSRRRAAAGSATCTCSTCRPASLTQLYRRSRRRQPARDGVVIDVRNNNGGFVNVYALDVLARRGYLNMTPRGIADGAGAHRRSASARSSCRRSSSPTSIRSRTPRISPKATAR